MALGDVIARLAVNLSLETAAFEEGATLAEKRMKQSARSFEKLGKKMTDLGQKLSIGVTAPLAVFAKQSVEGFVAQEQAMADVEAALKSMGGTSGKTAQELLKASDALELRSLYDGDIILKEVTANLLTFGNVAGSVFDRAQQAALDMATRLKVGPKDAAIQLGKALNDPIKGITALSRSGIQFSEDQKKLIKSMVETGQTAKAQQLILGELEKQFSGAAAAAADATPWRQAQVAIGQAMDVIGGAVLPIIAPVAEAVAGLARAFAELPEPVQKTVVVAAALAAALGPLLMVLGPVVGMMAPFLGAMKAIAAQQGAMVALRSGIIGITTAFGPMIAAAGAAYLVWKNWDDIAPRLQPLIDQVTALGEGLGLLEVDASKTQAELAKDDGWRKLGRNLADTSNWLQRLADDFDAYNARTAEAARNNGTTIQAGFATMWRAFDQWWTGLKQGAAAIPASLSAMATSAIASINRMVSDIGSAMTGRLSAIWDAAKRKVEEVRQTFFDLWDKVTRRSYVPDMVDDIQREMARLDAVLVAPAAKATKAATQAFKDMAIDTRALLDRLFPEQARSLQYQADVKVLAGAKLDGSAREEAERRLRREYAGLRPDRPEKWDVTIDDPGALTKGMKTVGNELKKLGDRAKLQTVRVADSFKDMAERAVQSLSGLARAIKGGGFLDILSSALSFGLQLGSMGVFGKSIATNLNKPRGYATGTSSAARGLAWVGERGPELVNFRGGERVWNNRDSMAVGRGGSEVVVQIVAGEMFDARVTQGAARVVQAVAPGMMGAASAQARRDAARPAMPGGMTG